MGDGRAQDPPPRCLLPAAARQALPTPTLSIINNPSDVEITEGRMRGTWAFQGHCNHGLLSPTAPEHLGCQEVSAVTGHTRLSRTRLNMEDSGVNIRQILLRLPPSSSFLRESTISGFTSSYHHYLTENLYQIQNLRATRGRMHLRCVITQREIKSSGSQRDAPTRSASPGHVLEEEAPAGQTLWLMLRWALLRQETSREEATQCESLLTLRIRITEPPLRHKPLVT